MPSSARKSPGFPRVLYIRAVPGIFLNAFRRLCDLAVEQDLSSPPGGRVSARLSWAHRGKVRPLHVSLEQSRYTAGWTPLDELRDTGNWNDAIEDIKRVDVVILLVADNLLGGGTFMLKVLREDLLTLGRVPEEVPVVFQVHRMSGELSPLTPESEIVQRLQWPICGHVEALPRQEHGAREALDCALDLYDAMRTESE